MQPVTISNRRLVGADDGSVSFCSKDNLIDFLGRWKTLTIGTSLFRRFLVHSLPEGFGDCQPSFFARISATDDLMFRCDSIRTSLLSGNFR
jgi:hypothetical protein